MTMKLEITDSQSNHSDYSCDSQSSQESSNNGSVATVPTTRPTQLSFASLDGLNSGVPTRTTSTITPTQLRGFDQTYIDIAPDHVRFVPPSVTHANNYGMLNSMSYCESGPPSVLHVSPGPLSASGDSSSSPGLPAPKRRNMGGRRPTKAPQDISPEEEERRRVRRERNKIAAARCRKRRMDHTNTLQAETDELEAKKQGLQDEIRKLHAEKENLSAALANHNCCRLGKRSISPPDVKPFQQEPSYSYIEDVRVKEEAPEPPVGVLPGVDPMLGLEDEMLLPSPSPTTTKIMFSATNPAVVTTCSSLETPPASTARINRPTFLQVPVRPNPAQIHNNKALGTHKIAGVDITTPSNGLPFNFDSLMDGGTGLTPVHPLPYPCAQQQRVNPDVTPPDSHNNSLVRL